MSGPSQEWIDAARKKRGANQKAAAEQTAAAERSAAEERQKDEEAKARRELMDAAKAEAAQKLQRFMRDHAPAARELLDAHNASIVIGSSKGGGYFNSVLLGKDGLRWLSGTTGGYSPEVVDKEREATIEEAVDFFAHEGAGRNSPDQVRNLTEWLTARINYYVGRN